MLKPLTSPANLQARLAGSNCWMWSMPLLPSSRLAHLSATEWPTVLTQPMPVTTTRRREDMGRSGLLVRVRVVDGVLHRGDLLGVLVGDLDAELIFQRHHQLHRVERVRAQVRNESLFIGDLRLFHAELLGDDLLDTCFDIAHGFPQTVCE